MIDERLIVMAQNGYNISDLLNKVKELDELKVRDPIGELYEKRKNRNSHYKWTNIESKDECGFD